MVVLYAYFISLIFLCVYCVCMLHTPCPRAHWSRALCTPMNISIETDALGRRKRLLELLGLEVAISCSVWVLG